MHPVPLYALTDAFRLLDAIKKPNARVKAAKAKTLEHLLLCIENMVRFDTVQRVD